MLNGPPNDGKKGAILDQRAGTQQQLGGIIGSGVSYQLGPAITNFEIFGRDLLRGITAARNVERTGEAVSADPSLR